jgi:membrane-associated protein
MKYRTFVTFNVVGGLLWAVGVTTLGYFLGQVDTIRDHVELAAIAIVAVSFVPIAIELMKHRREAVTVADAVLDDIAAGEIFKGPAA